VVAGHLPIALNYWSIVGPYVKNGRLRALAVASPRRLAVVPELPTTAEAGFPGVEGHAWQGIFVPAGTPKPIVARLHAALAEALNSPEIKNQIIETGAEVGGNSPEQFAAMIRTDQAHWKTMIADAKIPPE
jgi:tripartite-type tricarboxylate transporter receptor subunit TctC